MYCWADSKTVITGQWGKRIFRVTFCYQRSKLLLSSSTIIFETDGLVTETKRFGTDNYELIWYYDNNCPNITLLNTLPIQGMSNIYIVVDVFNFSLNLWSKERKFELIMSEHSVWRWKKVFSSNGNAPTGQDVTSEYNSAQNCDS